MRKYVIEGVHFEGQLVFGYNTENICIYFSNEAELTTDQLMWLSRNFPFTDDQLATTFPKSKIREVTDLSFKMFWETYNYKVGNKSKTEKLWAQLAENDRINALEHLKRYNYYLKTSGIAKVYPERYLSQRRWENELPKK